MELGERIERLVQLRGLTLRQAADRCGVDVSVLSRLIHPSGSPTAGLRGKHPRIETLHKVARGLDVLPEYLTGDMPTYLRAFVGQLAPQMLAQLSSPEKRWRYLLIHLQQLYGDEANLLALAARSGLNPRDLEPRADMPLSFYEVITEATGAPLSYFQPMERLPAHLSAYVALAIEAVEAGITPEELRGLLEDYLSRRKAIPG